MSRRDAAGPGGGGGAQGAGEGPVALNRSCQRSGFCSHQGGVLGFPTITGSGSGIISLIAREVFICGGY